MLPYNMRWTLKPKPDDAQIAQLSAALQVDALIAQLLLQRGINTYEEAKLFFRPKLSDLHDPFLMKDMDVAVACIENAIATTKNILIYGDYDVDGTTAVALVSSYLLSYYPNVATYIPDRYAEGYGISIQGIDFAADNDFSLIIALDCGVKAISQIAYAKERGIDFIVCDHHRPGEELPNAIAILDPKRSDCEYPYKELCGCGVGFKLIQALGHRKKQDITTFVPYLDLVATAIGADIVPITGENRILAYYGLDVINTSPRIGFHAILEQLQKDTLTISDVVFIIAPRINAAGRIKHGQHAVNLLVASNLEDARTFAEEIEDFNANRKMLDKEITAEALDQILTNGEEEMATTVVYKDSWHKGVIGIVASRLIETYYRPTLVFTKSGEVLAASARSVPGFDVYNALAACSEHLIQFGGHKYAAGLTLLPSNYEAFKKRFEEVVAQTIDPEVLTPELRIDAKISLTQLSQKMYRILKQFGPFGPGNMTPIFMSETVQDTGYGRQVGAEKNHLKVNLKYRGLETLNGIGFNLGHKAALIEHKKRFNIAYTLDENHWKGNVTLQLKLKDIQ